MAKNSKKIKKGDDLKLHWHFPVLDHGESEGLNDPLLQYFGGDYSWYVAREVIQNSIDARMDPDLPVIVKFLKINFLAKDIPGLKDLKSRFVVCLERAKEEQNEKAEKHYQEALETASASSIPVLRASDFNTTGLDGSDDDKKGKWHRLVWAVGENQPTGAGGGSYGIGKGAPFVASKLRTVYYSTKNFSGELIFQGKTRILSHKWKGQEHRGIGFYGLNGYESIRTGKVIPAQFKRTEQGTDLDIIGFGAENGWMPSFAKSVLDNFWMAIFCGDLEVELIEGEKNIRINKATLFDMFTEFSRDGLAYYKAAVAPTRLEKKQLPILGNCSLYIRQEEGFPKDVAVMRMPKMTVDKWKFRKTLQDSYAGVFVCEDDRGNMILRGLEPPEHDKWDENRDRENGRKAVNEITAWVRGILKEMQDQEGGDPEEIPELDKFLPFDEDFEKKNETASNRKQLSGKSSPDESPAEVGADREEIENEIEEFVSKPSEIRILEGARVDADPEVEQDETGGEEGGGGGGTGAGTKKSVVRINTSALRFRTIYASVSGNISEYCLLIDSFSDQEGAINIVAIGADSAIYSVPISYARDWKDEKRKYDLKGSFIHGLKLEKGCQIKIRLGIKSAAKYALGIEKYEG